MVGESPAEIIVFDSYYSKNGHKTCSPEVYYKRVSRKHRIPTNLLLNLYPVL